MKLFWSKIPRQSVLRTSFIQAGFAILLSMIKSNICITIKKTENAYIFTVIKWPGVSRFAKKIGLTRIGIYEALTRENANPRDTTLGKIFDALNIQNSASHSEFKITPNGEVRIIEIGARMGGACIGSDLVQISTGRDFIKMVIDVAIVEKTKDKKSILKASKK